MTSTLKKTIKNFYFLHLLVFSEDPYSYSSSSCATSVAYISNHGLAILSVVSSPDKLIVERFFLFGHIRLKKNFSEKNNCTIDLVGIYITT